MAAAFDIIHSSSMDELGSKFSLATWGEHIPSMFVFVGVAVLGTVVLFGGLKLLSIGKGVAAASALAADAPFRGSVSTQWGLAPAVPGLETEVAALVIVDVAGSPEATEVAGLVATDAIGLVTVPEVLDVAVSVVANVVVSAASVSADVISSAAVDVISSAAVDVISSAAVRKTAFVIDPDSFSGAAGTFNDLFAVVHSSVHIGTYGTAVELAASGIIAFSIFVEACQLGLFDSSYNMTLSPETIEVLGGLVTNFMGNLTHLAYYVPPEQGFALEIRNQLEGLGLANGDVVGAEEIFEAVYCSVSSFVRDSGEASDSTVVAFFTMLHGFPCTSIITNTTMLTPHMAAALGKIAEEVAESFLLGS
jgi:hypothetical protein